MTRGLCLYIQRPLDVNRCPTISQWFGEHPENYAQYGLAGHNGIDYPAPVGTPVYAAHDGIAQVGWDAGGYGIYIKIIGNVAETIYAHLSQVIVNGGNVTTANNLIGLTGDTGNSTGPHLHFGLRIAGMSNPAYLNYIDPKPFRRET